jgi:hypothetical protein
MTEARMRSRRSSARWLLLALLTVPGCLFRPIFHPPSATGGDGGIGQDAGENRHQDGSADASSSIDVPAAPSDDCNGFYDQSSGAYAPDAHHADGAICSLPVAPDAGTWDASTDASAPDVIDATADDASDTSVSDATDDTSEASVSDAADDASDSGTADDAAPADPDAGE